MLDNSNRHMPALDIMKREAALSALTYMTRRGELAPRPEFEELAALLGGGRGHYDDERFDAKVGWFVVCLPD